MTGGGNDSIRFLHALGRRIGVRVVLFVPVSRPMRVLWLDGSGAPADIAALEDAAREWLGGPRAGGGVGQDVAVELPAADSTVATAVCDPTGRPVAALVATKEHGRIWTTSERALVRFATDYYADDLARSAVRPWPVRAMTAALAGDNPAEALLERGMRTAAERGELFLLYQPEIDMRTGQVLALEALMRWDHPERGVLGPDAFIPIAEQSDLIRVLGTWVIEESLRELASWSDLSAAREVVMRINVSPAQVARQDLVELVFATMDKYDVPGAQICVEITENAAGGETDELIDLLSTLKTRGVSSAIDDLAAGYSSLGRLRVLPVDTVKIDRSLVVDLDQDSRAQAIVGAIVELGAKLGVSVVAEGVESRGEAAVLRRLGCVRAQGHLFAPPLSADGVRSLLHTARLEPPT